MSRWCQDGTSFHPWNHLAIHYERMRHATNQSVMGNKINSEKEETHNAQEEE